MTSFAAAAARCRSDCCRSGGESTCSVGGTDVLGGRTPSLSGTNSNEASNPFIWRWPSTMKSTYRCWPEDTTCLSDRGFVGSWVRRITELDVLVWGHDLLGSLRVAVLCDDRRWGVGTVTYNDEVWTVRTAAHQTDTAQCNTTQCGIFFYCNRRQISTKHERRDTYRLHVSSTSGVYYASVIWGIRIPNKLYGSCWSVISWLWSTVCSICDKRKRDTFQSSRLTGVRLWVVIIRLQTLWWEVGT